MDVELVIKMPENIYNHIMSMQFYIPGIRNGKTTLEEILKAIRTGTPLPKGHGVLKDTDELYNIFEKNCNAYNIDNLSFMSDMAMNFDLAPTIIEAYTESEET